MDGMSNLTNGRSPTNILVGLNVMQETPSKQTLLMQMLKDLF